MGRTVEKEAVVLVAALLARDDAALARLHRELQDPWGPISFSSGPMPFDFTGYYAKEMGDGLRRQFIAFARPVSAGTLRGAKIESNWIEERLSAGGMRSVNIDPGYLDLAALVVASTKEATYRVYLGEGIYAQPMLYFERGSFRPWQWTYRDYRVESTIAFFNQVRERYKTEKMQNDRGKSPLAPLV
ncbi:MAG: DUF4416 family protein [Candidatus Aureabacteria bacterium]|nr:DUF4416 family protein [Candidatus Auribacterota bacterium]